MTKTTTQIARDLKMHATVAPDATHEIRFSSEGAKQFADDVLKIKTALREVEALKASNKVRQDIRDREDRIWHLLVSLPSAAFLLFASMVYALQALVGALP